MSINEVQNQSHIGFKERLRHLREEFGVSEDEIGEQVHKAKRTVESWETGEYMPEDFGTLVELADYFGCTVDYLLGRSNFRDYGKWDKAKSITERLGVFAEYIENIQEKNLDPLLEALNEFLGCIFDNDSKIGYGNYYNIEVITKGFVPLLQAFTSMCKIAEKLCGKISKHGVKPCNNKNKGISDEVGISGNIVKDQVFDLRNAKDRLMETVSKSYIILADMVSISLDARMLWREKDNYLEDTRYEALEKILGIPASSWRSAIRENDAANIITIRKKTTR